MDRSEFSELTAEVYELDHPIDRPYRDVAYHVRRLADAGGRVLELGCGNGRVLVPLLDAGIDADGLDHSPAMLALCGRNAAARGFAPVLVKADMAAFEVRERYDAILVAAGGIKELPGRDAVLNALACCHAALGPDGLLVVDLVPPRGSSLAVSRDRPVDPAPMRYWHREPFLFTVTSVLLDYDSAQDRTTVLRRYERWRDGVLDRAELRRFCMQHWTLSAFEGLLAEAGFGDVTVVANYQDGRAPGPADEDWTFVARRS